MLKRKNMIKRRLIVTLLVVAMLLTSVIMPKGVYKVAAVSAQAYYVAANGSDQNPGTETSPFATLEKARDTIRELKSEAGLPDGGVTVYLRGGEYNLQNTFTLTPEDSGEPGKPVVYRSYANESAILESRQAITGWSLLASDQYPAGLPAIAQGHVYAATIPTAWRFHFMYVDDVSQPVAKSTQSKEWLNWARLTSVETLTHDNPNTTGRLITFPAGALNNIPDNRDAEISVTTAWWWNIIAPIDTINLGNNTARLQSKSCVEYPDFKGLLGGYFNIFNALPVLDEAGEWVVDSSAGKVYYWPKDDTMAGKTVFAPILKELVRLQGDEEAQGWKNQVHDIEIRDLQFKYTDRTPEDQFNSTWLTRNAENPDAMIYMQGVRNCIFDGNLIAYSGSQGIALDHYAQNIKIIGNEIAYNSSGGIQITGYGPGDADLNYGHLIERNNIHDMGLEYMHSGAVSVYGSHDNTIQYNKISATAYASISIVGMMAEQMNDEKNIENTDSYGNSTAMFQARWNELALHRPFVAATFSNKPYLHSDNNLVQYNICDDYMRDMEDGGALYTWEAGVDTKWYKNVGKRTLTRGVSIYMDNHTSDNTIDSNIFWSGGTGTFDNSGNTTNNWTNNAISASKPAGYDSLRQEVTSLAGGWPQILPLPEPTPAPQGRYEAEGAALTGVTIINDVTASGENTVGYFGDEGDSINFSSGVSGRHLKIHYANGNSSGTQCSLYVDGIFNQTLYFPNTGDWSKYSDLDINVPITGSLELKIDAADKTKNGTDYCGDIDYIEVSDDVLNIYEAESAILNGVSAQDNGNCSGGKTIGYFNASGDYINFNAVAPGDQIKIHYSKEDAAATQFSLYVNGIDVQTISLPSTGSWANYNDYTLDMPIAASVKLQIDAADAAANGDHYCCNVDYIKIIDKGLRTAPAALASISVIGSIPTLNSGLSFDLNDLIIVGRDQYNATYSIGDTVTWAITSGGAFAGISGSTLSPVSAGSGTLTATVNGITSSPVSFTVSASALPTIQGRYEAENALFNGVTKHGNGSYSGGFNIKDFDTTGDFINFNCVVSGNHLKIHYSNGASIITKCSLYINGIFNKTLSFPTTGDASTYSDLNVYVPIAGNSSIKLQIDAADETANGGNGCCDVDYIEVTNRYEGENASLNGVGTEDNWACSGGKATNYFKELGDSVNFSQVAAGNQIRICYSNGNASGTQCSLYVNGTDVQTILLPTTQDWPNYSVINVNVPIPDASSVKFQIDADDLAANGDKWCCNFDYIEIPTPPQLSSITVSGSIPALTVSRTGYDLSSLSIAALDGNNASYSITGLPVTWTIASGQEYGAISESTLNPVSAGAGTLTATMNGITSSPINFTVNAAATKVRYEGESAELSGVTTENTGSCSEGGNVNNFKDSGTYMDFKSVVSGNHLTIRYANGDSKYLRQCSLYVNGVDVQTLHLACTKSWSNYSDFNVNVDIPVGASVKLQIDSDDVAANAGEYCCNVDYVEVSSEVSNRYEAENATLTGAQAESNANCSEGNAVGFFKDTGFSINFSSVVNGNQLRIRYSNGSSTTKQCSLYVNGTDVQTLYLTSTGDWPYFSDLTVNVPITGSVKIQIDSDDNAANGDDWCCNVDYIEIPASPQLTSISVDSSIPLLTAGGASFDLGTMNIGGKDQGNASYNIAGFPVTWAIVTGGAIASISGSNLTPEGVGSGMLMATVNGTTSSAISFTVSSPAPPRLASITVSGSIPALTEGTAAFDLSNLTIAGLDQYSTAYDITNLPVTWTIVSGGSFASISGSNLKPVSAGTGTVTAMVDGITSNPVSFSVNPQLRLARYEAENAELGGVTTEPTESCSGGRNVNNFKDSTSNLNFSPVVSGNHLRIHYSNGSASKQPKQCSLYVDGTFVKKLFFSGTGGWSNYSDINVNVSINASVRLQIDAADNTANSNDYCCNVDFIEVSNEVSNRYEAEDAILTGAQAEANANCSGGKAVGFFRDSGFNINFNPVVTGNHLRIHYSNGSATTKQCSLYVNGLFVQKLYLTNTGDWPYYSDLTLNIPITGSVKIQIDSEDNIANSNDWCCNVDYIEVLTQATPLPAPLASITVSGSIPALTVGETGYDLRNLTIAGKDQYSASYDIAGLPITWDIASGETYGAISGNTLNPVSAGTGTITAAVDGVTSNTVGFTVNAAPTPPTPPTTPTTSTPATPTTPTSTPATPTTPTISNGTIEIKPEVKDGTAKATIGMDTLSKIFEQVKEDKNGVKTAIIKIKAISATTQYVLELPKDVFATDKTHDASKKIEIKTDLGTIVVPDTMFSSMEVEKAKQVAISIGQADLSNLGSDTKQKLKGKPVIEFNATVDGKAIEWKNNDAPVTISIDYKPTTDELKNPDGIVVWYIDGKGSIQSVPNARYDIATGKVTFKTTCFSTYAVAYNLNAYSDLKNYNWAKSAIEMVASKGIMIGTDADKFSPGTNITRAEFIDALVKALGLTAKFENNFSDVKKTDSYYESVGIAKKLGITTGTGNSSFSPDAQISRQEMSVLVVKAMELAGKSLEEGATSELGKFDDKSQIAGYAIKALASLVKEGILVGGGNNLNPKGKLTRAQTAVIIYKIFNK